jgi:lipoprotein-anchoring transpeptidase ErfK/SrfK
VSGGRIARVRRTLLVVALVCCGVDAVAGAVGPTAIDPPQVQALAATPVPAQAPDPPFTVPAPTYPPIPHLSPQVTSAPTTTIAPTTTTSPPATAPSVSAPASAPAPVAAEVSVASEAPPPANVARVKGATILVWNEPADPAPALALFGTTEFGTPRVLLTTGLAGEWVQVLLPTRPNGARGWVRAQDVDVSPVDDRVDVDLAARTLTWTRAGQVVLETAAGIGSRSTPTPTGTFFVTDVLPFDPSEGRGRWVVALNGHSDAYDSFEGGDARIAIHGTNAPSSIGAAVSNGCVRIGAGPLDQLRSSVPLGTPVVIH